MKRRKNGFTLAEVLITLGIIGVVAALTIPTLMANYQKVQEVAGLKKAYAEVTEALKLMANDHGCPDNLASTGAFGPESLEGTFLLGNEFKKYFKLSKDCGFNYVAGDETTKCFSDSVSNNYDGSGGRSDMNSARNGDYNFITADGFAISLYSGHINCNANVVSTETNLNLNKDCGSIRIDVNGLKGPNNYGRDIFWFEITDGKGPALYPAGGFEYTYLGSYWGDGGGNPPVCSAENPEGRYCAGRIMEQGWQMKY